MYIKHRSLITLFCLFFLQGNVNANDRVIYGQDNRQEVFASQDSQHVEWSRSTAALIPWENLKQLASGDYEVVADPLTSLEICKEERFSDQPIAAICSGFLVAPDIMVSAGHCIKSEWDCDKDNAWVFGYQMQEAGVLKQIIKKEDVHTCSKLLARDYHSGNTKNDFSVVKLHRPSDRPYLDFRKEGKIEEGQSLVMIGHPSGLPTKISDGANVRTNDVAEFFVANLDAYGGNSGSAVINETTGKVEGILVRGERDYWRWPPQHHCMMSLECEDDKCRGEDVTRMTHVRGLPL